MKTLIAQNPVNSLVLYISLLVWPCFANATIVEIQTNLGNIQVNLFDQTTPITTANFLSYINAGAYDNTIIHRSEPGFVIQGGGFRYDTGDMLLHEIPTEPAITNEAEWSNQRGTISMAKLGGNPNSATSQWFINLVDNSSTLDGQNNGYAVFGQVTDTSMALVDTIATLSRFNFGTSFQVLPLRNYTDADFAGGVTVTDSNYVLITSISIIDTNTDSAASLSPTPNTGGSTPSTVNQNPTFNDSGSGSISWLLLLCLSSLLFLRHKKQNRF